ncbi:MAG: response regulator transcription factor [Bacteroidales bacterium]|jgi:DNA-binding response OmpR family regulator|nr:response regulator transcription factor [Bacteroidales bacterium]
MSSILIVDDDFCICEILEFNLKSEGFDVTCAYSAEEALTMLKPETDLILLDVMMGGMSGYKMAEKLRKDNNPVPIIFLTAKDTENEMLTGFSVGGDDYIAKPFSIKEVTARIKAVLKRVAEKPSKKLIQLEDLVIDLELKEVRINNEKIILTKTEFELFSFLIQHSNRFLQRQELIDILWKDTPYITERTVDVHITRLRKKLGTYASTIVNRSGFGYRFDIDGLEH